MKRKSAAKVLFCRSLYLPCGFGTVACPLAVDHEKKNHVKHSLDECKGAIFHKTSLD